MIRITYCLLSILLIFTSCAFRESLDKKILGKWTMHKVYDGDEDVTSKHNPENNRWIKFNRNGSYESGGDPYGYNDGNWELDNEKSILFLDSKIDDDDSEWKISFTDSSTVWTGIGTPRQENFKLIHKR
ncbi:hypothetical protein [Reichenbachiella sp. MALMAid0571]|uniref:hypothetical protein n=1 Tax=Reichenbachiella sp. MALMAid0571 TaxID=3143939 RepID=UPI0032E02A1C